MAKKKARSKKENPVAEAKDELEQLGKDTLTFAQKHHKAIMICTSIAFGIAILFVLALMIIFGIKMQLTIKDELELGLTPLDATYIIPSNSSQIVEFTLRNDNMLFCSTHCSYIVSDLSTGEVLKTSAFDLENDDSYSETFTFTSGDIGSGQKLYSVEFTCQNVESLLCITNEEKRYATSLITIDYDLSAEQKSAATELGSALMQVLDELSQSDVVLQQYSHMITSFLEYAGLVREDIRNHVRMLPSLQKEFSRVQKQTQDLVYLWDIQDYSRLGKEAEAFDGVALFSSQLDTELKQLEKDISNDQLLRSQFNAILNASILNEYYLFLNQTNATLANEAIVLASTMNEVNGLFRNKELTTDALSHRIVAFNDSLQRFTVSTDIWFSSTYSRGRILYLNASQKLLNATYNATIIDLNLTTSDGSFFYTLCDNISTLNLAYNQSNLTDPKLEHFSKQYCGNFSVGIENFTLPNMLSLFSLDEKNFTSSVITTLQEHLPTCCVFGECQTCCLPGECSQEHYPIIFLHGHSFNKQNSPEYDLLTFTKMQRLLQEEGYLNAGVIDLAQGLEGTSAGYWGKSGHPVTVRASYYYLRYTDLGFYQLATQKSETLESYALRLKEIIDYVQFKTGQDKVVLVAHSMGGLVAREYIALFGEGNVAKLALLATPNGGIPPSVERYCGLLGSDEECSDMAKGSLFLKRLSTRHNSSNIPLITIAGSGCAMPEGDGDGIVLTDDVALSFADNYIVEGECTDFFETDLHSNLIDPEDYPEAFDLLVGFLKE